MITQWMYYLCLRCDAKWFSRYPQRRCPRCIGRQLVKTPGLPPWLGNRAEDKSESVPAEEAAE